MSHPILQVSKLRHRRLTLPEVTQPASGGAGTLTQAAWLQSLCGYTSSNNNIVHDACLHDTDACGFLIR